MRAGPVSASAGVLERSPSAAKASATLCRRTRRRDGEAVPTIRVDLYHALPRIPFRSARDDVTPPSMPQNRLARESSPYLLQHAGNPVDWYPWGPEALERAKREDKPILLSIG